MRHSKFQILALALLLIFLLGIGIIPDAEIVEMTPGANSLKILHKSFNTFYTWKAELFTGIFQNSGIKLVFDFFLIANFLGWVLLILSLNQRLADSLLLSFLIIFLNLFYFGKDLVLISSTVWIPWLTLSFRLAFSSSTRPANWSTLALLIFSILLISSGNYLGLSAYFFSVIVFFSTSSPRIRLNQLWDINKSAFFAILISLSYLAYYQLCLEMPAFPEYPSSSHVLVDAHSAGNILPLVAPSSPMEYIDHNWIYSVSRLPILVLFIFSLWAFYTKQIYLNCQRNVYLAFGFASALLLETLLPTSFSYLLPLTTLTRNIPWLFFTPFLLYFFYLTVILLIIIKVNCKQLKLAYALIFSLILLPNLFNPSRSFGYFLRDNQDQPLAELSSLNLTPTDKNNFLNIMRSPSYPLIREYGIWILQNTIPIKYGAFKDIISYRPIISSSSSDDTSELDKMQDRHVRTRWSSQTGSQTGKEWVHLEFNEELWLYGMEVSPGIFHSDFPRGLKISYSPECNDSVASGKESYQKITEYPSWPGSLAMTEHNYPYLTSSSIVKVFFQEPVYARCLLINQIGKTSNFDWSIARLRILRADKLD